MKKTFDYRKYSPEYKKQVISLLDQLWKFDETAKYEYFKWKFEDNPYTDDVVGYIALDGDKVVAFRGYMVEEMQVGDKTFYNAQLADTVTDLSYRRMGLFQGITKYSIEELEKDPRFEVSLNSSSGGPTLGGYVKLGWRPLSEREHLFRFTVNGIISKLFKEFKIPEEIEQSKNGNRLVITNKLNAEDIVSIPYNYNKISHVHDIRYYQWRFANPRNDFRYAYLYSGDKLKAYMAFVFLGDGRYDIVDFNTYTDKDLRELLSFFCNKMKPLYVSLWTVGKENIIFKNRFKFKFLNLGFILKRIKNFVKPPFLVRGFKSSQETDIYDNASWDLYKITADEV